MNMLRTYSQLMNTYAKESDNESDRISGYGPAFGSLVLESDGILLSEFNGTYQ